MTKRRELGDSAISFIADHLENLETMARAHNHQMLAHMIAMAKEQAQEELQEAAALANPEP